MRPVRPSPSSAPTRPRRRIDNGPARNLGRCVGMLLLLGQSGLDAFREKPGSFDIVLLDLLMPGLTGEQTLEVLRTIRPDIPVLIISGFTETDVMHRLANDRGPFKFLHKPFKRADLEQKLRELLG